MPSINRTALPPTDPATSEAFKAALERVAPVVADLIRELVINVVKAESLTINGPVLVPLDEQGIDARKARYLVRTGQLRATKIKRRWYAAPEDLRALLPASVDELPDASPIANEVEAPRDGADEVMDRVLGETGLELGAPPPRPARKAAR